MAKFCQESSTLKYSDTLLHRVTSIGISGHQASKDTSNCSDSCGGGGDDDDNASYTQYL